MKQLRILKRTKYTRECWLYILPGSFTLCLADDKTGVIFMWLRGWNELRYFNLQY